MHFCLPTKTLDRWKKTPSLIRSSRQVSKDQPVMDCAEKMFYRIEVDIRPSTCALFSYAREMHWKKCLWGCLCHTSQGDYLLDTTSPCIFVPIQLSQVKLLSPISHFLLSSHNWVVDEYISSVSACPSLH